VRGPGEKLFVDWAGQTVPIHDPTSGAVTEAHVFVAVLGASNKTFVAAFPNEQLPAWIAGHVQAYAFFGGVAKATVPDNPKTAVSHPCRYEPQLHRTYQELAEHYGTVILPARIKKPRDKAKVETGVQIVERQILAVLRHQRFFSVAALNQPITPLLAKLNAQPFQNSTARGTNGLKCRRSVSCCPCQPKHSNWPCGPWRRSTSTTTSWWITTTTVCPII
jgi:transposase